MPDPIKKTTSYDPATGETTFRASWSGSKSNISRGPITPKTTQRTVAARQVSSPASKVVASRSESAGQRMAVAFKSPTAAGTTGMELKAKADVKERAPESIRREKIKVKAEMDDKALLINNPGMKLEDIKRRDQKNKDSAIRKSNRSVKDEGGFFSNDKQKSGACRTC
jgi:hypothetical protein